MNGFIRRYKNAMTCIAQIKAGEWKAGPHHEGGRYYDATRKGKELWLANGAFFCEIKEPANHFGYFWRHFVWWLAARKIAVVRKEHKEKVPVLE